MVIDRERAADLGVDTADIATALRLMVGGDEEVSRFRDPAANEDYDVQLRLAEGSTATIREAIPRLYVPGAGGELVQLDNFVTLERSDHGLAHRPPRPPAPGEPARPASAPGYALADRLEALRSRPSPR